MYDDDARDPINYDLGGGRSNRSGRATSVHAFGVKVRRFTMQDELNALKII
jgi:hypothetical protein